MRRILVFIWCKILAFDISCQADLLKDKGQKYFLAFLNAPPEVLPEELLPKARRPPLYFVREDLTRTSCSSQMFESVVRIFHLVELATKEW